MTTPDFRAMSANSFIQYLVPLLQGGSQLYPLPVFDPQAVADEVKRRLKAERGCGVPNPVLREWWLSIASNGHATVFHRPPNDYELDALARMDIAPPNVVRVVEASASPPIDFSRPLVWCENGSEALYNGDIDWTDPYKHLVRDAAWINQWIAVNSTGHDRSGRRVVRQKEER